MCGLTGIVDPSCRNAARLSAIAESMTATLLHRGPDSGDIWVDPSTALALGHRRLSIIDLSPEGRQPMHSDSGRYVIAFNGEIYNFNSLRSELVAQGRRFRGHSDTEVLLSSFEHFGLEPTLHRITGMFAFALWDRQARRLHLARDHMGKKPLYYGWVGDALVFASELKAIVAHPGFNPQINREALTAFLRYQYVPAPWSIWKGIYKLPPASVLSLDVDALGQLEHNRLASRITAYWSVKSVAERNSASPLTGPAGISLEQLDAVLSEAVAERMIADVPLGAFLSGGVDSSLVVALMQAQSTRPVRTFTIGFNENAFNEAEIARKVAAHLGTDHTEFTVTAKDALAIIPDLPRIYDEPFADPSAVPTVQLTRLAKSAVTVCLSGDGGDEVFAGYGRYALASRLGRGIERTPRWLRSMARRGVTAVPVRFWDSAFRGLQPQRLPGLHGGLSGDRMHKLANMLGVSDPDELYHSLISLTLHPEDLVRGGREPLSPFTDPARAADLPDRLHRMMYRDTISYLPDDILVKVDRASMAASLEVRSPLLDHRVIELAWRLPASMLRQDGDGKWPLRQLFDRHLPRELRERPKQGFAIPVAEWLRGPLRDWAEDLLSAPRLEDEGLLNPAPIRRMWNEHLHGARNWSSQLWTIAMFQAWRQTWAGSALARPERTVAAA